MAQARANDRRSGGESELADDRIYSTVNMFSADSMAPGFDNAYDEDYDDTKPPVSTLRASDE